MWYVEVASYVGVSNHLFGSPEYELIWKESNIWCGSAESCFVFQKTSWCLSGLCIYLYIRGYTFPELCGWYCYNNKRYVNIRQKPFFEYNWYQRLKRGSQHHIIAFSTTFQMITTREFFQALYFECFAEIFKLKLRARREAMGNVMVCLLQIRRIRRWPAKVISCWYFYVQCWSGVQGCQ